MKPTAEKMKMVWKISFFRSKYLMSSFRCTALTFDIRLRVIVLGSGGNSLTLIRTIECRHNRWMSAIILFYVFNAHI